MSWWKENDAECLSPRRGPPAEHRLQNVRDSCNTFRSTWSIFNFVQVVKVQPLVPEISFFVGKDGEVGRNGNRTPCAAIQDPGTSNRSTSGNLVDSVG